MTEQPDEWLDFQAEGVAQLQLVSIDDHLALQEEMQLQSVTGE